MKLIVPNAFTVTPMVGEVARAEVTWFETPHDIDADELVIFARSESSLEEHCFAIICCRLKHADLRRI